MGPLKLLHIIEDKKFFDYAKATYEFGPFVNTYTQFSKVNLGQLNQFDFIVLHYLKADYIVLFEENIFPIHKIIWTVWGADLFCLGAFFNKFLLPVTLKDRTRSWKEKGIIYLLKMKLHQLIPRFFDFHPHYKPIFKMIGLIENAITLTPNDGFLLQSNYNNKIKTFHINYVDPIFANDPPNVNYTGENILLGNSAEFTNNHKDFLQTVSAANLKEFKFIIPLSYGDKLNAKYVENYVKENFPNNALVLNGFLDVKAYNEILNTCEIAVMPQIRQQALGNIVKLLYGGCHVYMYPQSGIYQFLQENNFSISAISSTFNPQKLTFDQKVKNKKLTIQFFGKKAIHLKIESLFKSLI